MEDICIDYCEASICPDDCKYLHATDEKRRLDKEDMDILDDLYKMYDDGYNQALEDFITELKDESSKEWKQFDNWYEFIDCIKNKLI